MSLGESSSLSVEAGSRVTLSCSAKGNPSVFTFEWLHSSGRPLPAAAADSDTLPLNVRKEDAGLYTCRVRNSIGSGEDSARLDVLYRPEITVQPEHRVAQGDSLTLQCAADANPPVESVRWLGPDGRTFDGPTVDLRSISRKDAGNYTCEASNTLPLEGGPDTRVAQAITQLKVA